MCGVLARHGCIAGVSILLFLLFFAEKGAQQGALKISIAVFPENLERTQKPTAAVLSAAVRTGKEEKWDSYRDIHRIPLSSEGNKASEGKRESYRFRLLFSWLKRFVLSPADFFARKNRRGIKESIPQSHSKIRRRSKDFKPIYHSATIEGMQVAYSNPFGTSKLEGVVLLFHACTQAARDWFELPEHRRISAQLLRKKLALLAFSSSNRVTGCWSTRFPHTENADISLITVALRQWLTQQGLNESIRIHGVGISSGATMLSVLAAARSFPRIASQALYISSGSLRAFKDASNTYPNTLFVHVATDQHHASFTTINNAIRVLKQRHVQLVGELSLSRVRLSPDTFWQREPRFSRNSSHNLFMRVREFDSGLRGIGSVCSPELCQTQWNESWAQRAAFQILRVARGEHEVSAKHAGNVAMWLVANGIN